MACVCGHEFDEHEGQGEDCGVDGCDCGYYEEEIEEFEVCRVAELEQAERERDSLKQVLFDNEGLNRLDSARAELARRGYAMRTLKAELAAAEQQAASMREGMQRIADGDVPNVEFCKPDIISEFARSYLSQPPTDVEEGEIEDRELERREQDEVRRIAREADWPNRTMLRRYCEQKIAEADETRRRPGVTEGEYDSADGAVEALNGLLADFDLLAPQQHVEQLEGPLGDRPVNNDGSSTQLSKPDSTPGGGDASATARRVLPEAPKSTVVAEPGVDVPGARPEISEAIRELFDAITPQDGSEGDLHTAAMLAPHAYAEITALQSSTPALSDEERERLQEMAAEKEFYAPADAAFLRNLASQEHRGEESGTDCCGGGDKHEPFCDNAHYADPSPGEVGSNDSSAHWPRATIEVKLPMERNGATPLYCGKTQIGYRSGSTTSADGNEIELWFALDPAHFVAQPGEVGRLRERLLGDEALLAAASKHRYWDLLQPDSRMTRPELIEEEVRPMVEALVDAAFPPPSDSQGDQEHG